MKQFTIAEDEEENEEAIVEDEGTSNRCTRTCVVSLTHAG